MKIKNENNFTIVEPELNKRLTNGEVMLDFGQSIILGSEDEKSNWSEIDELKTTILNYSNNIIPNPNGSEFKVVKVADDSLNEAVLCWLYNTNDYCGGTIPCNPKGIYKEMEIQYKSDNAVPLKIQLNEYIAVTINLESTEGEYVTIRKSLPDNMCINNAEIYIQSDGSQINGGLYIFDISLIG